MNLKKILAFTSALVLCGSAFVISQINEVVNNNSVFAEDTNAQYTGTYGENVTYSFEETTGTLTISGTGNMKEYSIIGIPWTSFKNDIKSVVIEEGVTSVGNHAFEQCTSLESVTIASSVTVIDGNAFSGCTALKNVIIPNGVTTINGSAFSSCTKLTSVSIPSSIINIGNNAFSGCVVLTSVTFEENSQLQTIGDGAFSNTSFQSIDMPVTIQSIGNNSFADSKLNNIDLSNCLELVSIGQQAFYQCRRLATVTLSNSLETIDSSAFSGCIELEKIIIPASVTYIGETAFTWCNKLTSVTFEDGSNPTLAANIFNGNQSLANVILADSMSTLGNSMFYGCNALTHIKLPKNLKTIPTNCFCNCKNLESAILQEGIISIESSAFSGCINISTINIPQSVTDIKSNAFYNCSSLKTISLPQVEVVNGGAFSGCTSLSKVYFGDSLLTVQEGAFSNTPIMEFTLPKSLVNIGDKVFGYNNANIIIRGFTNSEAEYYANQNGVTFIEIDAFDNTPIYTETYVNCLRLRKYILGLTQGTTDLDFNNDGQVNVLDMIELKHQLFN